MTQTTSPGLVADRRLIPSDTPGIELQLINRHTAGIEGFSPERTLVMMHGATFPSASLFDVAVDGSSFMDALARAGYDVWAVDARGYGGSTRPPDQGTPLTQGKTALRDLRAAVEFVCRHRGVPQINVLGMSWGATIAGAFAAEAAGQLAKLVLVTPLWLSPKPRRIDPGTPLGGYRTIDVRAFETGWKIAAPESGRHDLIPGGWFDAWAQATLATDPDAPIPGTIRAPAGAVQDVREHWTADNPLYDPAKITCPVLIVAAEWDIDVPIEISQGLFVHLTNARTKRLVEIGEATHMVLMEKNRRQAFDAVIGFLGEKDG